MKHAILSLLLLAAWAAAPACGASADTNALLQAWLGAQGSLRSWSAEFVQTRALKVLREPLRTPGRLWFVAPDQFRWELGDPPQTIALRRTNELFVIYPKLKRAERYPLGSEGHEPWRDALALLDAGFPSRRADFEARFRLLSAGVTNDLVTFGLEPRSPTARRFMNEIRLTLRTNDFSMLANELRFADGSTLRNDFTNAVANGVVPPGRFDPALPPDLKLVEPARP